MEMKRRSVARTGVRTRRELDHSSYILLATRLNLVRQLGLGAGRELRNMAQS